MIDDGREPSMIQSMIKLCMIARKSGRHSNHDYRTVRYVTEVAGAVPAVHVHWN